MKELLVNKAESIVNCLNTQIWVFHVSCLLLTHVFGLRGVGWGGDLKSRTETFMHGYTYTHPSRLSLCLPLFISTYHDIPETVNTPVRRIERMIESSKWKKHEALRGTFSSLEEPHWDKGILFRLQRPRYQIYTHWSLICVVWLAIQKKY